MFLYSTNTLSYQFYNGHTYLFQLLFHRALNRAFAILRAVIEDFYKLRGKKRGISYTVFLHNFDFFPKISCFNSLPFQLISLLNDHFDNGKNNNGTKLLYRYYYKQ